MWAVDAFLLDALLLNWELVQHNNITAPRFFIVGTFQHCRGTLDHICIFVFFFFFSLPAILCSTSVITLFKTSTLQHGCSHVFVFGILGEFNRGK